ncbi:uncharacterized protein LOC142590614 isoform X3 [Dermacentor variabilis]|uniref:uncharacterized protein LOC142590614 isoform X3 n=1 Tax=Dermacentor variabilis TaxID=34621 RepID=UPI003F5BF0B8
MQVARQDDAYREAENAAQRLQRKFVNIDQSKVVNARFQRVFLDRNFDASCNVRDRLWFDNNLTMIASVTDDEKQQCIKCLRRRLKQTAVPTENLPKLATHDGSKAIRLKKLSLAGHHWHADQVSTVPWGSSETLPGSSEHSFRGTDSGDATTIDSEQHVAFATEQHSVAFSAAQGEPCAQCKTVIVLNSMLCSVGVGCTCAQASVGKACTGTQTTASTAALHVDKKGLVNVTSLGERSRATRVTSRLASHKISQATAALQFDLPVAHKSVQCIPRVKSKSTQFSTTGTRTSRTLQTRRAVNRPSSDSGNWHSKGAHDRQLSRLCFF